MFINVILIVWFRCMGWNLRPLEKYRIYCKLKESASEVTGKRMEEAGSKEWFRIF